MAVFALIATVISAENLAKGPPKLGIEDMRDLRLASQKAKNPDARLSAFGEAMDLVSGGFTKDVYNARKSAQHLLMAVDALKGLHIELHLYVRKLNNNLKRYDNRQRWGNTFFILSIACSFLAIFVRFWQTRQRRLSTMDDAPIGD